VAELTIRPGFLEQVKAILKKALIPTRQEPGCEAFAKAPLVLGSEGAGVVEEGGGTDFPVGSRVMFTGI